MAVGQIIGRVSVKVMPHTKDFRKEAERDLSRIEKALDVTARVLIDPGQMKVEALKAVRDVNRVLRSNNAYKVKFHASIARTTMAAEIKKAQRALENKARSEKIKFDADVAAAIISAALDRDSLRTVEKELKKWRDDISPLSVGVRPEIVTGTPALVSARLDVLTRPRTVAIIPKVSETAAAKAASVLAALSGGRVLNDIFSDLWDSLKNLDKAIPTIGSVAFAILGLGGYALTAGSNLFALSQSLAQIGPAALALPGIFGGIAIGLGATVAVLKDFNTQLPKVGDAFSRLQDRMSQNFWEVAAQPMREMIWSLLPQLRAGLSQTATELGGFFATLSNSLKGQFDGALQGMFADLSESIAIASQHTQAFATIIRVLGEVGAGYLPRLASWFGDISDRFANFLKQAQDDGSLVGWIDRGIFQLQELGRAASGLGSILAGIATAADAAGGSNLTMMADTLQRVADIVNGPTFQTQLTGVLLAAHEAMNLIATNAGPAMTDFFNRFATTLQTVLPIAGAAIGALGDALFTALANPAVQTAFTSMISGLAAGIHGLLPAFEAITPVFATLMDVIGALGQNLGPVLAAAFAALAPAVNTIGQALIPVVNMLGPILTGAITALTPVFNVLGEQIAKIAVAAQPLIQRVGELINLLMPVLAPALSFIATLLGSAIIGAIEGAISVFDGIKTAVQGFVSLFQGVIAIFKGDFTLGFSMIWDGIKGIFSGAFTAIVGAIKVWLNIGILSFVRGGLVKLLGFWKNGWTGVKAALTSAWNGIKSVVSGAWNFVKNFVVNGLNVLKAMWLLGWNQYRIVLVNVWNAIRSVIGGAIGAVRNTINNVLNGISALWVAGWGAIRAFIVRAWDDIASGVSGGITKVIDLVKGLPAKAKAALSGIGTALLEAGKSLIDGLIAGITSKVRDLTEKLNWITDKLPDWKGPAEKDAVLLYESGRLIMDGLIKGLDSRFGDVKKALYGLTAAIPKGASKGLRNLIKANQAEMKTLLKQYEDTAKSVKDRQQALNDIVADRNALREQVRTDILNGSDITKGENSSFTGIVAGLKQARDQANKFAQVLRDLVSAKTPLNDETMKQLLAAGPEAGLAAAESILAAGQAGIKEINGLQADVAKAADSLSGITNTVFKDNIDIAQALVDSATKGKNKIVNAMKELAREINKAIAKEFGKPPKGNDGKPPKGNARVPTASRGTGGKALATKVSDAMNGDGEGRVVNQKILNYHAAPGRSLSAEEDLFEAADRGRMVGW